MGKRKKIYINFCLNIFSCLLCNSFLTLRCDELLNLNALWHMAHVLMFISISTFCLCLYSFYISSRVEIISWTCMHKFCFHIAAVSLNIVCCTREKKLNMKPRRWEYVSLMYIRCIATALSLFPLHDIVDINVENWLGLIPMLWCFQGIVWYLIWK